MLCSTDASVVLALPRPIRDRLPADLVHLIETESGLNDPVAVVIWGLALAGGAELLGGSGLLAAYISGLVIANNQHIDGERLVEAHAGFVKMAELSLFLCLGLVLDPVAVVGGAPRLGRPRNRPRSGCQPSGPHRQ